MFALIMNPVRGRCEDRHPVVRSESREALESLLVSDRVQPRYTTDDGYHRAFKRDSPLYDYNYPYSRLEGVQEMTERDARIWRRLPLIESGAAP